MTDTRPSPPLQQTPLHACHVQHGARLVDFAGWSMPIQYTSIMNEHRATRHHVGLFDVSHMGRLAIRGPDAGRFLERMLTRSVAQLPAGRIRYSLITRQDGGILDDVLVYRRDPAENGYWMVVNASNRAAIVDWLQQHLRGEADDVELVDHTESTAMIAVQGPAAVRLVAHVLQHDPVDLRYYAHREVSWRGAAISVSRTGYTGEDGVELVAPAELAEPLWRSLCELSVDACQATPAGLGARDTLRLEAALPLYGQELGTWCDPYQAGLAFAVDLQDAASQPRTFPGCEALRQRARQPGPLQRVGLVLDGRRPARPHFPILHQGTAVGEVTSGTFSPTLEQPIAMGYVPLECAEVGTPLEIDVRGDCTAARVVPLPFYRRPR